MDDIFTCADLKSGEMGYVFGFDNKIKNNIKRRLLELGFVRGKSVKLLETSFMSEVFLLELNGYLLSVRKDIITQILLSKSEVK